MEIKILGTGCNKCDDLYDNVVKALSKAGKEADIEKVENIVTIMSFGVMSTPALVIDGKVVISGRSAKVEEIEKLLK
ncbi:MULTISPECIES: thioredoxin family protein [Psychrilyobacter]|uniref:Thioredoxin family protein n=1 Tax=Psychrilyobacter piezotolerans TaxID=2293438 RepID=A0ABX9KJ38_9FUSO|nr:MULTISPECIES: thioredoxin family protein [Psychrilyobacter]MCS5421349.1 thioredoxin family protein [Psychrilyobacter sp. S5]NDI77511.1 thioredoxin family protein [Psychrilyobacter piezotolerans]RDE62976.1 thioredoxin family protein [Psychrilyobacter sp. S5]REI41734.1 thioredoxin family protein [Psychrilyobacter piezotolerans]